MNYCKLFSLFIYDKNSFSSFFLIHIRKLHAFIFINHITACSEIYLKSHVEIVRHYKKSEKFYLYNFKKCHNIHTIINY